jgi:cell division protein FtsZ
MGIGIASGEDRAIEAARKAIHSKLLEVSIDGATDAIVNITSGTSITLFETEQALSEIRNATDRDLNIIYGTVLNQDIDDELIVTVIATGYELKAKDSTIENLATEIFNKTTDEQLRLTKTGLETQVEDETEEQPEKGTKRSLPSWLIKKGKI